MKQYIIGVDLGGTKVEACLMDTHRDILTRHRRLIRTSAGMDAVLEDIDIVIKQAAGEKSFIAVGIGTPGTYVPAEDRLYGSPNSLIYETPGFLGKLQYNLGVPLLIENDANCLALAEYVASCAEKYRYVMAVIIGTGMGYGLILDGKLYRGARGGAGEIGHTTIDFNGRVCGCGRKGCAEAYLSGPSLSRRFYEETGQQLDVPGIYRLYQAGDPRAKELFDLSLLIMGEVFANVINALDLEAIILGGGVSNLPIWYEKLGPFIKKSLFGVPRGDIPVIPALLGDSAGVIGAAYLALRHLGIMNF
ncbi:MAG TPA: ROK family protein [Candidatus Deferrimicrobium sp.]|nr:ROK family protein [Candidatus Deferrimicrobium sp.]